MKIQIKNKKAKRSRWDRQTTYALKNGNVYKNGKDVLADLK